MPGKRWLLIAIAAAFLAGNGCCAFCDRWCGHNYQTAPVTYAQPACVPVCPQPVCCPVGSSPAQPVAPTQGWQRSYYYVDPCCH